MSFIEFKNTILQRLGLHGVKRVEKLFYRIPISVLRDDVKYDSFIISSDEDLQVLFHCRRRFPKVRTPELLAKLVDVVSSSGDSNRNPYSAEHPTYTSSMHVGSSSVVPVIAPEADLVASPSFVVNLNHSDDPGVGEAGLFGEVAIMTTDSLAMVPVFIVVGVPDGVEDAVHDDDDDVEPATIADDSDDETPWTTPPEDGGASSSGTNQYSPHFSALDLDAIASQGIRVYLLASGQETHRMQELYMNFRLVSNFRIKRKLC
ncbi:uncharacterized protein LOC110274227 [Arachis duranensis]|uniref:Uncharacterized protein LOC110274227 n=1 Tax=Arachis duranensis TaxID=130453 RepID=A0A6P5MLK4_ARADU|nr:uncharacterized protein LOC110274227 [Arachis duranensis]